MDPSIQELKTKLRLEGGMTNTHRKLYEEYKEKRDDTIVILHARLVTQVEIAHIAGCSVSTVSYVLKRRGIIP